MIDWSLSNVGIYSAEIFFLVLAGGLGSRLLDVRIPRLRFEYWRAVVAGCLMLPILALLRPVQTAESISSIGMLSEAIGASASSGPATTTPAISFVSALLGLLVFGIVLRTLWLLVGLARLRRLRRQSEALALHADIEVLRQGLAFQSELRTHPAVQQPITFGLRRPIVLLPLEFDKLPVDTQRAVACHELLHIHRRDWSWMIAEEIVRTVFWFHPAMRWALNQLQLGREQLVDARVVEITGSRRVYMNALLMFSNRQALLPATLFARRSQLVVRIRGIAEEVRMSRAQLALTGTLLTIVLAASTWAVASAMPLRVNHVATPDQAPVASAETVRISLPGSNVPKVVTQVRPEYPPDLLRSGVGAAITLTVVVNAAGRVTEVRDPKWQLTLTEGNSIDDLPGFWARKPWQAFVEAAGRAMNQWTFEPGSDSAFPATVLFQRGGGVTAFAPAPPPPPPPPPPPSSDARLEVLQEQMEKLKAAAEALKRADASARAQGVISPVPGSGTPGQVLQRAASPPPPLPPPPPPPNPVLRVGGAIRAPQKIYDVRPVYPESAQAAKVAGIVILEIHIAKDGTVANAQVLRSIPLLDDAALEAVRQWQFTPTLLNGEPIEVIMAVTVNFTLQ